jgi:transposase-like protein
MSILSQAHFQDEAAAFAFVEAELWPEGPNCPHCGGVDRISAITPNKAKKVRIGLKFCGQCRKQFTVRVGTIFEDSHLPMTKWLQAIFLMCSSKKGISSHQLMRTLECTYKTAWFLSHRIREAMKDDGSTPMGGAGVTLEVDETFWGQQATVFVNGKGWQRRRGTGDMQKIVTLVERGGRARSIHVADLQKAEVVRAMQTADRASVLNTDQAQHYRRIGKEFADHSAVDHGREEYVRYDEGTLTTTNTVEGFFSIFKRGMRGVYQHCGDKHLHRYVTEFDFRYSNRVALGVDDQERASRALAGVVGKRLTYRRTGGRGPGAGTRSQAPLA